MADRADIANDLVLERIEQTLLARKPASLRVTDDCEGCGEPIPSERLQAMKGRSCTMCVPCQARYERRAG
ncbi:TraR/DksA C4-type zinc finger protein [Stutzerimonas nitrititolerans]|uniref:TraR/DksA C4-type zinc finger protein n=1 Tax=Stutzerimonas nitrititolerans TaxID=2482751 RepID=UPI003AA873D6